ncbi:MAG: hypothetical protein AAF633_03055 [Chloroflexota bacterium]
MNQLPLFTPGRLMQFDQRLVLLSGQSIALGILLGFVIVGSNAIFLPIFGSGAIAYVYLVVALFGSILFYGMARLQQRFSLITISVSTLILTVLAFLLIWIGLMGPALNATAFAYMVSFSIVIQLGFVVLGGQAGRLFNVQEIKQNFPRIVAGFVVGFLLSGVFSPWIVEIRNRPADLALGSAIATGIMLLCLILLVRRYRSDLTLSEGRSSPSRAGAPPIRKLLLRPYILYLVLYQFLSAMATNLINFIFLDQTAARFATETEMATFLGRFTIGINSVDLFFTLIVAGWFLTRFGLRWGLMANPIADLILLIGQLIIGSLLGIESTTFFWLVMAAWIADIAFTDGSTRGSINTAYQALPTADRAVIQTGVEGIGVPLAIGLTGLVLLLLDQLSALNILQVSLFTAIIVTIWIYAAGQTYRYYSSELTIALKRRVLDPTSLELDGSTHLQPLLHSERPSDALLGIQLANDHQLRPYLLGLLKHPGPTVRLEALRRIEKDQPSEIFTHIKTLIDHEQDPTVKGGAIRTLCAISHETGVESGRAYLEDPDLAIRQGALVGLLRYGGIDGIIYAGNRVQALSISDKSEDRLLAARVLGELAAEAPRHGLDELLNDRDPIVQKAAILAAGDVRHADLLPRILPLLSQPALRSAASSALLQYGDQLLPFAMLEFELPASNILEPLARLCGQIRTPDALSFLREQLDHPDLIVRQEILTALSRFDSRQIDLEIEQISALMGEERQRAAYHMRALAQLGQDEQVSTYLQPLVDALRDEFSLSIARLGLLGGLSTDADAVQRAMARLRGSDRTQQALAYEMLEVTLSRELLEHLRFFVNPHVSDRDRLEQLADTSEQATLTVADRIEELATNRAGISLLDWTVDCAVYAQNSDPFIG